MSSGKIRSICKDCGGPSIDIDDITFDIVITCNIVSTGNDAVDRDLEMPGLRSLRPPLSLREHGRNTVTGTVPNR